jgi:hypothetical protein
MDYSVALPVSHTEDDQLRMIPLGLRTCGSWSTSSPSTVTSLCTNLYEIDYSVALPVSQTEEEDDRLRMIPLGLRTCGSWSTSSPSTMTSLCTNLYEMDYSVALPVSHTEDDRMRIIPLRLRTWGSWSTSSPSTMTSLCWSSLTVRPPCFTVRLLGQEAGWCWRPWLPVKDESYKHHMYKKSCF